MKSKNIIKLIFLITIVLFFSLYFTTMGGYYEYTSSKKNVLTEEAIKKFEEDVKSGKEIIASNYIEEEKDYKNKASKIGIEISNFVSNTYDTIMTYLFKQLENTINA